MALNDATRLTQVENYTNSGSTFQVIRRNPYMQSSKNVTKPPEL
jgi:hypothetical protein